MTASSELRLLLLFVLTAIAPSCEKSIRPVPDHPRLTPNVRLQDVTFHSIALSRDMPYRVILPAHLAPNRKLPVIYLLHGRDGGFRDWSNYSEVARFAEHDFILVMPEAELSYYVNAASRPKDRFEDYIVKDLFADVESRFPVADGRANRAIAGVSMGGFGAITLALKHPDLFFFAGGLSSALDVPSRRFSIKRIGQYRQHAAIFGSWGSETRKANDPLVLVQSGDPAAAPYFFLSCGEQEGLLSVNKRFTGILQKRGFRYEFHVGPGNHDWNQWNGRLESLFSSLEAQPRFQN